MLAFNVGLTLNTFKNNDESFWFVLVLLVRKNFGASSVNRKLIDEATHNNELDIEDNDEDLIAFESYNFFRNLSNF